MAKEVCCSDCSYCSNLYKVIGNLIPSDALHLTLRGRTVIALPGLRLRISSDPRPPRACSFYGADPNLKKLCLESSQNGSIAIRTHTY